MVRLADYRNAQGEDLKGLEGVHEYSDPTKRGTIVGYDRRQGYEVKLGDDSIVFMKAPFTRLGTKQLDGEFILFCPSRRFFDSAFPSSMPVLCRVGC